MAKRISVSQLKSKIRQAQQKTRNAVNNYNRAVREYNTKVNRAISSYNSAVRKHNATVRHNRQIIQHELNKLNAGYHIAAHSTFVSSVKVVQTHYNAVTSRYSEGIEVSDKQDRILDLVEQENARTLRTANKILDDDFSTADDEDTNIEIENKLAIVSNDLMNRWKGAIFSLNPQNPDAARHFCTSTRELFTDFIELKAPDQDVFTYNPNAKKTERGNATRKEKIKYMMRNFHFDDCVVDFANADIENILELFHLLSDATHGEAGRYAFDKLLAVKKRVEQGINFLCEISA